MMRQLEALARDCGVQTEYVDAFGAVRRASPDALVAVIRALGEDLASPDDAGRVLLDRARRRAARRLPPVIVAWDGRADVDAPGPAELVCEDGGVRPVTGAPLALRDLPIGYHALVAGGERAHVIAAPSRCHEPPAGERTWGVFAPLYALRSARTRVHGGADLTDLAHCIDWVRGLGGSVVGTLPLLAAFPDEPSPYLPVSRRFWNELYLDLSAVPEIDALPEAFVRSAAALDAAGEVDYPGLHAAREPLLRDAARRLWASASPRRDAFERWRAATPLADAYAAFRAGGDEDARRYHLYVQWLCREQLAALAGRGLYLDLPVGVHPRGFDAVREADAFAAGVSVGAPPDPLFAGGQDWTVPALHPERSRRTGHRYFAECVRAHAEFARVLRIDHVMGLFRRFWIPRGFPATEGVYVRMPADELVAVVCVESYRHRCAIVGEDLGTVEPAVRDEMARRGLRRMYVAQLAPDDPVPPGCVASLNTHDTPPFAAACPGADIGDAIARLAASEAWAVLVSLEDLWGETRPQNVPGTGRERPNWRRKMARAIDEAAADPACAALLARARR
ncbi:MAG: 4-alpha-glucanotransferase [Deltaproteobacteria bacterium]|nr:MAG: 4-alpha-glucanotransferase [Deltaproteobacteria bacterium]